ncbi:hypothetical protein ROA7450_03551 [Roseovarius albus]|uniref:Uncharacterized protein n=1 Tax=Roseovarius albus TaxID=1247867 RepID=A0A1X7A104_9RHOB|nr:hypothetical protein [Roseovarius albus]SLN66947.1 hypothetical protein ROA7450_03551 [Roseovarius albus]
MNVLTKAITGILAGVIVSAGVATAETQYMDDRSTPEKLVQSFYNAINKKQYARAYSYFSDGFAPKDYQAWVDGYAATKSVSAQFGDAVPDAGAGQIFWGLPVAISALHTDGTTKVYGGCYIIHQVNPGMQSDPPFQGMSINSAELHASDKPVYESIPKSCDSE